MTKLVGGVKMVAQRCRWLGLMLLLIALIPAGSQAGAGDGTLVGIQPAEGKYHVGDTFATAVRIEDVTDLYGADIRVTFDPTRLAVVESAVTPETELLSPPWFVAYNEVDSQAGTIMYVVTLVNPSPPVSGSGAVFSFHFKVLSMGTTDVEITEVTLCDIDGMLIPAATAGAEYHVGYQVFVPLVKR